MSNYSVKNCGRNILNGTIDSIKYIINSPTTIYKFVTNISDKFGWNFVIICTAIYGISQGLGEGWFYPAQNYYYLDVLKISPIQAQSYSVVTHAPWTIKPIYGILSDCFPIMGYHRSSYTTLSSGIGVVCWLAVATLPISVDLLVLLLLFLGNFSLACPEVMIDAVVAERSKRYPTFASPLQSYNYGILAFCGIFGTFSSGYLIDSIGPKALLGVVTVTSLSVFLPSLFSYLGEGKKTYIYEEDGKYGSGAGSQKQLLSNIEEVHSPLVTDRNVQKSFDTFDPRPTDTDRGQPVASVTSISKKFNGIVTDATVNPLLTSTVSTQNIETRTHESAELLPETRSERTYSFRDDEFISLKEPPLYKLNCACTKLTSLNTPSASSHAYGTQCIITLELLKKSYSFAVLGIAICFLVLIVACTVGATQNIYITAPITFSVTMTICIVLYCALYKKHSVLVKATIFLFLRECFQPNVDTAFFYWYVDAPDGPNFSPEFVGYINTMSYVAMLLGIFAYSIWLRSWSYRGIFTWVQIALVITNLMDLCLVLRLNLLIGIPDQVFILGDSTIGPVVKRLYLMPMYVMASKLCPDGAEATLFSIMMSLSNFGYDVGTVFGSILLSVFYVSQDDWSGFPYVLAIKSVLRLAPIFFIPFLVPRGSPDDPPETMLGGDGETNASSDRSSSSVHDRKLSNVSLRDDHDDSARHHPQGYTPVSSSDVASKI